MGYFLAPNPPSLSALPEIELGEGEREERERGIAAIFISVGRDSGGKAGSRLRKSKSG